MNEFPHSDRVFPRIFRPDFIVDHEDLLERPFEVSKELEEKLRAIRNNLREVFQGEFIKRDCDIAFTFDYNDQRELILLGDIYNDEGDTIVKINETVPFNACAELEMKMAKHLHEILSVAPVFSEVEPQLGLFLKPKSHRKRSPQ